MNLITKKTLLLAVLGAGAATFAAFKTYPLNPRWPLVGGFHYVVDLNTTSFPPNSVWDQQAQFAMSDWRDIGATGFTPGFRRSTASAFNNTDRLNTWGWSNQPTQPWLGVCYVRWLAPDILEADIVYNSRTDYTWSNSLVDPCKDHPYWPVSFRGVARHECGHAIGLDHENPFLCQMNPLYERGTSIPHTGASGELPLADDKFGCRFLYYSGTPTTFYNLMATCWRPGNGQATRIPFSGSVQAGGQITFPVYIQNQTNNTVAAAPTRLGVYLSANDVISTGDTRIADVGFTGSWSPYGEQYYAFTVNVPATTPPGTWHVGGIIDWSNALGERYEGDNAARLGTITVTAAPRPNLTIDAISLSNPRPQRGELVTMTTTIRNTGGATAPASTTYFYVDAQNPMLDVTGFLVVNHNTPAIGPFGTVPVNTQFSVPDDVCGERTYYLRGIADMFDTVSESSETDNERILPFTVLWEQTPGFKIGRDKWFVEPAYPNDKVTLCAKSIGQTIPANTWYFFAWTASGTTPGIPIPPHGVLPLNWDVLTDIGFAIEGLTFHGSNGQLSTAPQGSIFTMDGGSWLNAIHTVPTHFAAIFVDPTQGSIVGISPMALLVQVR
jgi:hypothetical protein